MSVPANPHSGAESEFHFNRSTRPVGLREQALYRDRSLLHHLNDISSTELATFEAGLVETGSERDAKVAGEIMRQIWGCSESSQLLLGCHGAHPAYLRVHEDRRWFRNVLQRMLRDVVSKSYFCFISGC